MYNSSRTVNPPEILILLRSIALPVTRGVSLDFLFKATVGPLHSDWSIGVELRFKSQRAAMYVIIFYSKPWKTYTHIMMVNEQTDT